MTTDLYRDLPDEDLAGVIRQLPGSCAANAATSELLGRYVSVTYRWCRRYVGERELAMDLGQEALMSAYRRLDTYRGTGRFVSWMYVITRNCCRAALRRPALLRDEEADPDDLPADGPAVDQLRGEQEDEEALLGILRTQLDPREQEAIWLRCFERLPVDAITKLLSLTDASGARGVLQSARRKLRRALAGNEPNREDRRS